jgi:hypothetical protein
MQQISWCFRRPLRMLKLTVALNVTTLLWSLIKYGNVQHPWIDGDSLAPSISAGQLHDKNSSRPTDNRTHELSSELSKELQQRQLTVLVWNTKNDRWNQIVDLTNDKDDGDEKLPRSRKRCVYTTDRNRFNDSAGVLFYGDLMHLSRFPVERRPVQQKWIYLSVETPVNTVNTGIVIRPTENVSSRRL